MKNYRKIMVTSVIFIMTMVGFSTVSSANGLNEDRAWQFRSANKSAILLGNENLRLLKLGGYFQQWQVDQTFNCEAGATCTQIGHGGIGSQATTIGNYNQTNSIISTDNSVTSNVGDNSSGTVTANGNSGAHDNNATSTVTANQSNNDSSLGANVNLITDLSIGKATAVLGYGVDTYQPTSGQ